MQRFALPFDVRDTGYWHGPAEVAAVVADAPTVARLSRCGLRRHAALRPTLTDADLDRVVDDELGPAGDHGRARLVSVITDDLQHAGQAAFVRGILLRSEHRS